MHAFTRTTNATLRRPLPGEINKLRSSSILGAQADLLASWEIWLLGRSLFS